MPISYDQLPEDKLITQAVRGNKQAFGQLYENYLDQIYRYIFYRIGDHNEAEDLTEIVFLKAWEKLPQFKENAHIRNFRAWIYRIAHNLVIDKYRTRKQHVSLDNIRELQTHAPTPEEHTHMQDESQKLIQAISQLPPTLQQVIVCRFINQLSHAETARIIGAKEGYVRVLQYRALKIMRENLQQDAT